ncbi:unnamed protein product [Lactuca virosa]|uniref:Uncharacterized protein n=1 Tax=Lactuca virosa TaxID=75947 RepID=A0AAU9LXP6_9ASTR|nr:unnamed protein product [Lactuca virosa]
MDISNEATVDRFSIGPSTAFGRTIAFRVLFCKSMAHFRHQIFHILSFYFDTIRTYISDIATHYLMVTSSQPTRNPTISNPNRLLAKTLHKRENKGRNGLPEKILAKHDEGCANLRRMGSRCQDVR